jgi:hypothetical protein
MANGIPGGGAEQRQYGARWAKRRRADLAGPVWYNQQSERYGFPLGGGDMKLSQAAKKVIALAQAIREYWDAELPKRHPDYPLVHPGEDSGPPPPEEKKLRDFLSRLPEDVIYQLALIMDLGRGDFETNDLAGHYETLKETFGKPDRAASQMMAKAPLAEYLTDGLAQLKKNGIDVDHLTFMPVNSKG